VSQPSTHPFAHARKDYVRVNGLDHGVVTVPAHDPAAPVLLMAHGGPGAPVVPFLRAKRFDLRDIATVCLWDQRGAGMSARGVDYDTVTLDQLVDDAARVSEHVLTALGRERAVLMGYSWGAYLGAVTAARHPSLFASYIGVGLPNRLADGERVKWHFFREQASRRGDGKTLAVLDAMADEDLATHRPWAAVQARETARTGTGMARAGYAQQEKIADILRCDLYSWRERIGYLPGFYRSRRLIDEVAHDALADVAPRIDVPVHVFAGAHDYLTPAVTAREFYDAVEAPSKTWTDFVESAHSPFLDEPRRFRAAVATVLAEDAAA